MHGPSEGVSEETDEANSAVKIVGGNVFVELDPDHPGFKDEGYRSRRNEIAKIALEWNEMSMDERITVMSEAPTKQLTFADLQALPTSKNSGNIPKNPLD